MHRVKVMIVDDSAVVRQVLTATLADSVFAMERMNREWPDVLVLEVEMPRVDGITFLRKIMAERPTPVVVCSTLTEKGAETTLQALAAGAVSIVTKPTLGLRRYLLDASDDVTSAVKTAARANLRCLPGTASSASAPAPKLSALPCVCPGIVIVPHMPEKCTAAFAARFDGRCQIRVREAKNGYRVLPGQALAGAIVGPTTLQAA